MELGTFFSFKNRFTKSGGQWLIIKKDIPSIWPNPELLGVGGFRCALVFLHVWRVCLQSWAHVAHCDWLCQPSPLSSAWHLCGLRLNSVSRENRGGSWQQGYLVIYCYLEVRKEFPKKRVAYYNFTIGIQNETQIAFFSFSTSWVIWQHSVEKSVCAGRALSVSATSQLLPKESLKDTGF